MINVNRYGEFLMKKEEPIFLGTIHIQVGP